MKNAGSTPVICDFWATWCGPCQRTAPLFELLSREFCGKATFAKLNADMAREILKEYNVKSIPTFIVFKNGAEIDRKIGACDKAVLTRFLSTCIDEEEKL